MQSWSRSILKGILSYANEVGPWHVWINSLQQPGEHHFPPGWRGDGVIARVDNPQTEELLNKLDIPVIDVSDDPTSTFSAPKVRTDDALATKLAAHHLIDRGLKNIAFCGPGNIPNTTAYEKLFRDAISSVDAQYYPHIINQSDPDYIQKIIPWLHELPKPVGIMVWGHGFARNVVDCCLQENIVVPHDVAILSGIYDELFSHACHPALSGVLLPTENIGYQSAKLLHQILQGEELIDDITLIPPRGVKTQLSTDTMAIDDPRLAQVITYIKAHAFESITTDDILKEIPMARRSLERRFRQAFGRSPAEEVRRLRIDKARKLLTETDLQMQEIAESCGYATYNYLTHVFKKTTGMTPRSYRSQFRD